MNVNFHEWLQNKQLQTDFYIDDKKQIAKQIVQEYRKQPGPGYYNHSHYSDFWSDATLSQNTSQNFFGCEKQFNYPEHFKAPGIGNAVKQDVGPATYHPDGFLTETQLKIKKKINSAVAIREWQQRLFDEKRAKNPKEYPNYSKNKILPGPGHYIEDTTLTANSKTYRKPFMDVFGSNADRKVLVPDPVQMPTMKNPGPGSYIKDKF